jgi:hypothetical protein
MTIVEKRLSFYLLDLLWLFLTETDATDKTFVVVGDVWRAVRACDQL